MSSVASEPLEKQRSVAQRYLGPSKSKWLVAVLVSICLLIGIAALAVVHYWPFSKSAILQNLRSASDSDVSVRAFRETYFPFPGCVLEGLVFHHGNSQLITIDRLTIRATYTGLLAQKVSNMTADGMHIVIPPFGTSQTFQTHRSPITIDEIVANNSTLEFMRSDPREKPLHFNIHEASLKDVGWKSPLTYRVKISNPEPPGEITASGKFGVWDESDPGSTPVSGEYKFEHADLGIFEGISGELSSTGQFDGKLAHIDIAGTTDVPKFEVDHSGHPIQLKTKFTAYVDGTNGDTFLKRVDVDFLKTHIIAEGRVAGSKEQKGKIAIIDFRSSKARIEDLLRLFVKADRSPMSGSVVLQGHTELAPGDERFLKKIKLRGGFGISNGEFSAKTQEGVDKLSAGARGESDKEKNDPQTVLSDLKGQVNVSGGNARLSGLTFNIPGAASRMDGSYNLLNHKIDLRGQLRVDSKISNTTTGGKAFLLKMMEPFFKKKRKGEVVPVKISGTYDHPQFGLDLNDEKAEHVKAP